MEIENNPKLYHQYIEQPPILPNSKLFEISPEAILSRMDKIVERIRSNTPPPFSQTIKERIKLTANKSKTIEE